MGGMHHGSDGRDAITDKSGEMGTVTHSFKACNDVLIGCRVRLGPCEASFGGLVGLHDEEVHDGRHDEERDQGREERTEGHPTRA